MVEFGGEMDTSLANVSREKTKNILSDIVDNIDIGLSKVNFFADGIVE
jgi:hypothetical protein